jgi:flagellar basal body rod protein FlgC
MYTASVQGIKENLAQFYQHAKNLQNIEKADIAGDMVGMMIAEKGVSANVTAIKTANKMYSQLIDILA